MPTMVLLILLYVEKSSFLRSDCLAQCRDRQPIAVVDLGETCANIKAFSSIVKQGSQAMLDQMLGLQASMPAQDHTLFRLEEGDIWVKLRPGVRRFLRRLHDMGFELWFYTNMTMYAFVSCLCIVCYRRCHIQKPALTAMPSIASIQHQ